MVDRVAEFPKLTSVNSYAVGGMVFWIQQKYNCIYTCYEYKTGLRVVSAESKDKLKKWLDKNIERVKERLNGI